MEETVFIRRPTPDLRDTSFRKRLKAFRYHLPDDVKHDSAQLQEAHELGSYELQQLIGKGGMGEVWKAKHSILARPAAVKLIRSDALGATGSEDGKRLIGRFEREAQAPAALQSPHSIVLYDFGTKQGLFYYVMELLRGLDFSTLSAGSAPCQPSARSPYYCRRVIRSRKRTRRDSCIAISNRRTCSPVCTGVMSIT